MKKRQILWAIVFGSMLAITGCGDDPVENGGEAGSGGSTGTGGSGGTGGTGGSSGSGGSGGGDFCTTLCEICGGGQQGDCEQTCDAGIGQIAGELDSCPSQLDTLGSCLEANGCDGDSCEAQWTAWITCLITSGL